MFSYYGSKSIVVDLYPRPVYNKIIEPCCGSARYSLRHFENDIILIDKYDAVIKVWHYLQKCSPKDILGLPKLVKGMEIDKLNISDEEKLFLGFQAGIASISPRNKVSKFSAEQNGRKNQYKRIADQLFKIKHWVIKVGDFKDIPNQTATWFCDFPYQFGGIAYLHNKINFVECSEFAQSRQGQVIVCENTKANWLPFKPMSPMRGANGIKTIEAIWSNLPTQFDSEQLTLAI